jgi:hypothetical protein
MQDSTKVFPSPSRSYPQSPVAQSRRRGACGEAALVTPRSRAAPGMPRSRAAPGMQRSILCSPPSVDAADLQLPRGCSMCFLCLPPIAVRHGVAGGVDGHGRRGGDDAPHARSSSASLPFLHSSAPPSAAAPSWSSFAPPAPSAAASARCTRLLSSTSSSTPTATKIPPSCPFAAAPTGATRPPSAAWTPS